MKKSKRNIRQFGRLVRLVGAFWFWVSKMRENSRGCSGRKLQNGTPFCGGKLSGRFARGYSLIETLMVVLIIGILTAVALPQYQRAVAKAEYARAQAAAATLARGMDAYYATYKKYTPVMENLDVTIDYYSSTKDCSDESTGCTYTGKHGICTLRTPGQVYCRNTKDTLRYYIYLSNYNSNTWAGKAACMPRKDGAVAPADDWTYKFCQKETGTATPNASGLFAYVK